MPLRNPSLQALLCVLLLTGSECFGQEATNITSAYAKDSTGTDRMILTFDLVAPHNNIPCFVRVKYAVGSRQFYLKSVTGDAGNMVMPGKSKQIVWDYREELVHQTGMGEVSLEIEAFPNITVRPKLKKGKNIIINLDDVYQKGVHYSVFLYRHDRKVALIADSLSIQSSFTVNMPKRTKAGKDYQVAIIHGDKSLYSNTFRVRRRVGLAWYILPVIAAGVYYGINNAIDKAASLPGAPEAPLE